MSQKPAIVLPEPTRTIAEKRAREEGFDSVETYLSALVDEDRETGAVHEWMRERIEEGLRSPNAGTLSRAKLDSLVEDGIARVSRNA